MKKILLLITLLVGISSLRAQDVHLYLQEEQLPNLVNCLPAPPDTIGEAFTHDIMPPVMYFSVQF